MDDYLQRLVENALDFLNRSIDELKEHPKYSVIHFHAAVELFLKARLMADHWTLVVGKRQEPDWDKFVAGDFVSVSLDEAASKLKKAVKSGLTKQEYAAFRAVTNHRNKMVHFFHEAHPPEQDDELLLKIVIQQLNAWYLLHRLINERWSEVFEGWAKELSDIDEKLRKHSEFLKIVFENLKEEIDKCKAEGLTFRNCPSCGFESQEYENCVDEVFDAECRVCGLIERCVAIECPVCKIQVEFTDEGFGDCSTCGKSFEPDDIVEHLIDSAEAHIGAKEGDYGWQPGNCSDCDGYHTLARVEDDKYFCTGCFSFFDSVQECEWCNETNTGEMEDSYALGCNFCDGMAGWQK